MHFTLFIDKLDKSTKKLLQILSDCTPAQLHFKNDKGWSITEIIEHLCLTDALIKTILSGESEILNTAPEIIGNTELQRILVEFRGKKLTSPEVLEPKGEIKDIGILINVFLNQRDVWKKDLISYKIKIDNRVFVHPVLGKMTCQDWLNFTIHHTQRHIEQITDAINKRTGTF
jgi:uncharacterized damage-inducible protein DinB